MRGAPKPKPQPKPRPSNRGEREMNTEEMHKAKAETERGILLLIKAFERQTGLNVDYANLINSTYMDGRKETVAVSLDASL